MERVKNLIRRMRMIYVYTLGNKLNVKHKGIKGNSVTYNRCFFKKLNIKIRGTGNQIILKDFSKLLNTKIFVYGNNNTISIGKECLLNNVTLWIEDNNNEISIGDKTTFHGETHLAAIEGTKIAIGEDCMFSSNILFQTGDSHSIIDIENNRINSSRDIRIGNHVWVGTRVTCLKNTEISDNCIIGATATVCGKHLKSNCIIGGVPAKILKENINWLRQRI